MAASRSTATAGPPTSCRQRQSSDVAGHPAEGFVGELRAYQAEALAWIGFLDAAELGGCLALDMGLGKTPTVLAHLARTAGGGTSLVIAPAAVVGNWAAEAARSPAACACSCTTARRGRRRQQLEKEIADADVVITTYATAVRDIEALDAPSGTRSCSTRRRRSRTRPARPRSSCGASPPARGWR